MDFQPFPQQRAAIEAPLGPILVLAGPGAGKTFCLIARVEHLIREIGLTPARICAVTFTNKAAEEVAVRLSRRLGPEAEDVTRSTLHSLCLDILREHGEPVGLRPGFGVADEHYQSALLRRLGVPPRRRPQLLTLFSRRRLANYELTEGDEALFDSYRSLLHQKNVVDFDEIIALTAELMRRHPEAARATRERWDYLLVDEFQDLDPAQYVILKRLAEDHRNLFAVGDDEQSIFSWRGADPRILWRFRTDFGIETPVILDRNYRCSRRIFEVSRRLLARNPVLFDKVIEAYRESEHPVDALAFEDEVAEASWIIRDLLADREASGLDWGEYAILYRRHRLGRYLEDRLVAAGIPCRLARGHSLLDDEVIAYVVASLRAMAAPDDPIAIEAFADRMLPRHLTADVQTLAAKWDATFLEAIRRYARARPRAHPDTKKAWRFIYHVENLRALYRSHDSLDGLIEGLLSERVRRYGNALEERHDELTDPAAYPGASELADRLSGAVATGGRIWIEAENGVEIALRGMLAAAEFPSAAEYRTLDAEVRPNDVVLPADGAGSRVTALYKALQLLHSREFREVFRDYVTFDLETTDLNPAECEIVEIAAARVRDGEIVDTFHSLIRCRRRISERARQIHGYTEADLEDAPTIREVWPRFREFVGDDVLVAHNAHRFDFPVLQRVVAPFADPSDLALFDTLPLARALFRQSARLTDLAERFGIEHERAHHALDDALALARIFGHLNDQKLVRARKTALANLLDYLALGLALEGVDGTDEGVGEEATLLDLARVYALGRYSHCLEFYEGERERSPGARVPHLEEAIERLGGRRLMERIRAERSPVERYPAAVGRLRSLVEAARGASLKASVQALLERVALSTSEGVEAEPHRVNLLTLHATKGLEFSRVHIAGVEDYEIPGYHAVHDGRKAEIEEARRLLYVGMTRARDRLVLTRAAERFGRPAGGSMLLDELELVPVSA